MFINVYRHRDGYSIRCYANKQAAIAKAVELKDEYKFNLETTFEVEDLKDLTSNEIDSTDISDEVLELEKEIEEEIAGNYQHEQSYRRN